MDPFLENIMADDSAHLVEVLGEPVEYRPINGTPRTVYAVVDRKPVDAGGQPGSRDRPSMLLTLCTNNITGIDPATVDFDRDRIYVQYIPGLPNGKEDRPFGFSKKMPEQDVGMWTFLVT